MSVTEYKTQFTALSQFAGELVSDERWKCQKIEAGLIPSIAGMVIVHAYTDYRKLVDGALRAERQLVENKRIKAGGFGTVSGTSTPQTWQTQSQSQQSQQRHQQSEGRTHETQVHLGVLSLREHQDRKSVV